MRGLKRSYLEHEAVSSMYGMGLFLILAVHATMGVIALAMHSHFVWAVLLALPTSLFWRRAGREGIRSARLFSAANSPD